ncbi:MAG TPA: FAD-dependent oxidoreductase [Propionibacteriaceae bacterium]
MPPQTDPIIVIGGGLAGMAAAARLAKVGHQVELYEAGDRLGGRWAPYELGSSGVVVDKAPSVLGFPAPWRDLFRKSGRPLEAELARNGYALVPAEPVRVVFADGSELTLPTDRGEQFRSLTAAYGEPVAGRWRDLLDRLDDVWQTLRPLGLELELPADARLSRPVRDGLLARRTVADLANSLDHPRLRALVRSVAYAQGSEPEQTPALAAVELSALRTFGAWHLEPLKAADGDTGRSSVLVDALAARLKLRKVTVHLNRPVSLITVDRAGRATGIETPEGRHNAAAVISTVDPWTFAALLPRSHGRPTRRRLRRLEPAPTPLVSHELRPEPTTTVSQTTTLTAEGRPTISWRRPAGDQTVHTVHDFTRTSADEAYGVTWRGFASRQRRPPISSDIGGLYTAGPFSPAGPGPSQVLLSGALASYACHDRLD